MNKYLKTRLNTILAYRKDRLTEGMDLRHNIAEGIVVHERRFPCERCGKVYKWRESLFKHRRIECGKPPQFACKICGNRFMHKHHLVKHLRAIHQFPPLNGADIKIFI